MAAIDCDELMVRCTIGKPANEVHSSELEVENVKAIDVDVCEAESENANSWQSEVDACCSEQLVLQVGCGCENTTESANATESKSEDVLEQVDRPQLVWAEANGFYSSSQSWTAKSASSCGL